MEISHKQPQRLFQLGDIVSFMISRQNMTGQIVSLVQTTTLIAKVRCQIEGKEVFFYKNIRDFKQPIDQGLAA